MTRGLMGVAVAALCLLNSSIMEGSTSSSDCLGKARTGRPAAGGCEGMYGSDRVGGGVGEGKSGGAGPETNFLGVPNEIEPVPGL